MSFDAQQIRRRRRSNSLSGAQTLLAAQGPFGLVFDFTDQSIAIANSGGSLNFNSRGNVANGALIGPGAKTTYVAPSPKLTVQSDGVMRYQAHNIYLNSAAPANQSITVVSGASYAVTITGSVSVTASGAATGTWTSGTNTFTATTATLTLGSTSGSGTVHVRRTPSASDYVATTGAAVYALPYVWSNGVLQGLHPIEAAATNLQLQSGDPNTWANKVNIVITDEGTAPLGTSRKVLCNSTSANFYNTAPAPTTTSVTCWAIVKQGSGATEANEYRIRDDTAGVNVLQFSIDYSTGILTLTSGAGTLLPSISLGNGWWIVGASVAWTANNLLRFNIGFTANAVAANEYFYMCHSQIETGTARTSPIVTYGATATRAVDNAYVDIAVFPNSTTEGLLFAEVVWPSSAPANATCLGTTANGTASTGPTMYVQAVSATTSNAAWNSGSTAKTFSSSPTAGSIQKIAGCFKTSGTLAAVTNQGQAATTSAASAWNGTHNRLQIGALNAFGAQTSQMVIRKLMYLPVYDTAKIQAITA